MTTTALPTMTRQTLPGSDLSVSQLCYGLASFGAPVAGDAALDLYRAYRRAGGNFFDTAHCYSFWVKGCLGNSERTLGACLRASGDRRNDIVIATKGGHPDAGPDYRRPDDFLAASVIARDIDESLERLGVDHIDLYWLHRDDPRKPVEAVIDTLNAEVSRGRIRHLGASNWTTARIAAANDYAAPRRLRGFVASQPQWNLAAPTRRPNGDPTAEFLQGDDLAWHERTKFPVIPYTPTGAGYFASGGERGQSFESEISRARLGRAKELAAKLNRSVNQVALAWLMCHPFPVIPILGTVNPEHLADALAATTLRLTPEQQRWLSHG